MARLDVEPVGAGARIGTAGRTLLHVGVVVRDAGWRTLPARVRVTSGDSSRWSLAGVHEAAGLGLRWEGELATDGATASFAFRSVRLEPGVYGRIGLCVLLPDELFAGCPYRAATDTTSTAGQLPTAVAPHPLDEGVPYPIVGPFESLEIDAGREGRVSLSFRGSLFELEDQRNWSDASFKVYSSPRPELEASANASAVVEQEVTCRLDGGAPRRPRRAGVVLREAGAGTRPALLPRIGVVLPDDGGAEIADPLVRLGVQYASLRSSPEDLDGALARIGRLPVPLELIIEVPTGVDPAPFADAIAEAAPARVLVSHADGVRAAVAAADSLAAARVPDVHVHASFYELNALGDALAGRSVAWPLTPQAHAFDDESIISTASTHRQMVDQLQARLRAPAVAIAPVEWTPRATASKRGLLPAWCDERLHAEIAAAWLVASVQQLARPGAVSATYFELCGCRGLIGERPLSPAARVLQALGPGGGLPVTELRADVRDRVAAFVVQDSGGPWAIAASLRPERQVVQLDGAFTAAKSVALEPYGVVRIDSDGRSYEL